MIDFVPQLACANQLRATVTGHRATTEQTLADLLSNGAALRVEPDGRVLAQFGAVRSGFPGFDADPLYDARFLRPVTADLVRAHVLESRDLLGQLGISLSDVDCVRVAELIAERARAAHTQRVAAGRAAQQRAVERRAEDATMAARRAELLRELADLDAPPATP